MSSRVERDDEARRLEQIRQQEQNQKANQTAKDTFAKTLTEHKAAAQSANQKQQVVKKDQGEKAKAQAALMARAGIAQTGKLASLMRTAESESKGRNQGLNRAADEGRERDATVRNDDKARVNQDQGREVGRAQPTDKDGRGAGSGGGGAETQTGQGGNMGGQPQGFANPAMGSVQASSQPQGAVVPQIPPAVLQEIVKRVMVGVDKEGLASFVVQFKEDVLGGATMQINAQHGKISAKFTTPDKNAARLLKASEGQLARAFAQKGMSLERLEVEGYR
jgi:flagellar hook-length control protein FliK